MLVLPSLLLLAAAPTVLIYPTPAGEPASADYRVRVEGREMYIAPVLTLRRGPASYGSFDFAGRVRIEIQSLRPVHSARILPTSAGIVPTVTGDTIGFELDHPAQLTLEINGEWDRALHLFANPFEVDPPKADDPNVLYFGPGLHDLRPTQLKSGQTVYLAPGAIVRPTVPADETPTSLKDWSGVKNWRNLIEVHNADKITIRGRGVLDMSALPWHARTAFVIANCKHVLVEGITMLDTPAWGVAVFGCTGVVVRNLKQICRRENSDGIDLCNTQDALVEDCFLRNNDDEICVKTTSPAPAQESKQIVVRRCVIWNERARGLGITSETRRNISDVTFSDCDIIHDFSGGGDCAALAVLVSDSGTMSNIRFEDIRVEQCQHTLIRMWLGKDFWGHDPERGHVDGVVFKDISHTADEQPRLWLTGCDATHLIDNVTLDTVKVAGRLVTDLGAKFVQIDPHVRNVRLVFDDTAPAAAPTLSPVVAVPGDPALRLTWTAVAPPPSGVAAYQVYRDGAKVAQVAGLSYTDTGLAERHSYRYRVAAVNAADREGPHSAEVAGTTLADTAPPRLLSLEPETAATLRVSFSEPVHLTAAQATLDGGATVAGVDLSPDGRTALLHVTPLREDQTYTLRLDGVTDRAQRPNALAATALPLVWREACVGRWPLDERGGTSAHDATAASQNGVLRAADPARAWGPAGLLLDGQGAHVELPASPALNALQAGDYTLVVRFTPANLPPGTDRAADASYALVAKRGYHNGLLYGHDGRFTLCHWLEGDRAVGVSSAEAYAPGHEYLVAGVVDRTHGEARLYVDGRLVGRAEFAAGTPPRAYGAELWRLGVGNPDVKADYAWPAKGVLRDVRFYQRAWETGAAALG